LNRQYLAYFALLAGWIWFCLWLYSHAIFPKLKPKEDESGVIQTDNLDIPVAFTWGSDIPMIGKTFESWKQGLSYADSLKQVLVIKGFYYRDEAVSKEEGIALARRRIAKIVRYMGLPSDRLIVTIKPREINADVRANPFVAVEMDKMKEEDLWHTKADTAEICFPLADTILLPEFILDKFDSWGRQQQQALKIFLTGTADGTGIAESSDLAIDRAMYIKDRWKAKGMRETDFELTAEQRSNDNAVQNRWVMIYFEKEMK
jgi:hypothetical protein